jgi:hypothetical protein
MAWMSGERRRTAAKGLWIADGVVENGVLLIERRQTNLLVVGIPLSLDKRRHYKR